MGIASIVAGALKRVPWTSLAMNYGPELIRRLGGKVRTQEIPDVEDFSRAEAEERLTQLQALYDEQREINLKQQEQLKALAEACSIMEAQVKRYRLITAVCAIAAAILAVVLLTKL